MSRMSFLLIISLFFLTSSFAIANEEFQKKCEQMAIEDEIPDEEIPVYIKDCIQNLIDEQDKGQASGGDLT